LKVYKGEKYICHEIKDIFSGEFCADNPVNKLHSLSQRELEIIPFIKKGLCSKEIAAQLFISVKTVEAHRYHILQKLNSKNVAELVNFCNQHYMDL
jgi:two-component system invasion response regulator UvrY